MELSTNIPTPRVMPIRETMFILIPPKFIREKVATTDTGIATEMISVEGMLRRKNSRTSTASSPPCQAARATLPMEFMIWVDWSDWTFTSTEGGNVRRSRRICSLTSWLMSTVLCPGCLRTASWMPSPLSVRKNCSLGRCPRCTSATSPRYTGTVSLYPIRTSSISLKEVNSPRVRRTICRSSTLIEPAGRFTFSASNTLRIVKIGISSLRILVRSRVQVTAAILPPNTSTVATPSIFSSSGTMLCSAKRRRSNSGVGEATLITMDGRNSGL
jgi:hypothetical protein